MKNKREPRSLTEWPLSTEPPSMNKDGRQSVVSTTPSAQVFTKWLANKSRNHHLHGSSDASGSSNNNNNNARGQLSMFPARLALALGMAKTLLGILLVAFGALALWEHAAMSYLGSGLWSGSVVLVCGLLGIMAGQQRRTSSVYVVSYLMVSVLALAAMGLLLIFTATGLARDTGAPLGFFVDLEEGERVDFLGTVPLRQRPIIINSVLIGLGVLSTILSLAASVICLREACSCYGPQHEHRRLMNSNSSCNSSHNVHRLDSVPNINLLAADQSPEGQARAYRLMRWLRQSHEQSKHHPRPPMFIRRLYNAPVPVAVPVVPGPPRHHNHHQAAFPSFVTGGPTAAYVIPAVIQPMIAGPPAAAAFYSLASLPPPSLHSTGRTAGHSLPGPLVQRPPTSLAQTAQVARQSKTKKSNKRTNTHEEHEAAPRRQRHQSCGTDDAPMRAPQPPATPCNADAESVASGYVFTGMDREIPEELILHSMTIRPPTTSSC